MEREEALWGYLLELHCLNKVSEQEKRWGEGLWWHMSERPWVWWGVSAEETAVFWRRMSRKSGGKERGSASVDGMDVAGQW